MPFLPDPSLDKMKLWIGGEICADIADAFREARLVVERAINAAIGSSDYGLELEAWDCIAIIRDDKAFEERVRFSQKNETWISVFVWIICDLEPPRAKSANP